MRADGVAIRVIATRLGVAASSVSVWVRGVSPVKAPKPAPEPVAPVQHDEPDAAEPTRRCGRCERTLPLGSFNRSGQGRQHWCREWFRDYFRDRGDAHRHAVAVARARRRAAAHAHLAAYLTGSHCADCGEDELLVLEFDHARGEKRFDVSRLANSGPSIAKLEHELALCDVVCANCHRRRTARRAAFHRFTRLAPEYWTAAQRRNRLRVLEILEASACADCGEDDPLVLDFDHRGEKIDAVTRLANWCSATRLEHEIAKCEIRCANCHAVRTRKSTSWRGASF